MLKNNSYRVTTSLSKLAAILVLCACAKPVEVHDFTPPPRRELSANDAIKIQGIVLDCELKAANRYDDGHASIVDIAKKLMDACHNEIVVAWTAFNLSPSDPNFENDNFKVAIERVEMARRNRTTKLNSYQ